MQYPNVPDNYLMNTNWQSDVLLENTNGALVVGQLDDKDHLAYTQVGAIGPEWSLKGNGDFLGTGHQNQFLMFNTNGAIDVGYVLNGKALYTQVGAVEPLHTNSTFIHHVLSQHTTGWSFAGTGDYMGDGRTDFLLRNANGALTVGEVGSDGQAHYTQVGAVGSEWKVVGSGDFLANGHDQFMMENTSGTVVVANVAGGHAHYTDVGGLGPQWSFVGTGHYTSVGQTQFLVEDTSGHVFLGEVDGGSMTFNHVADLGPEWKFVGTGNYDADHGPFEQFMIENPSGVVVMGSVAPGTLHTTYTQVGGLGHEWSFH